jgi:uncharacterized HhH-GPD family protein
MNGDLYITGDPAADALLNRNGTALMIGMLLDQQVPMEWAFTGPHTIKTRIGHLDPARIAATDVEEFVAVCCEKPAIHRFPASMARRIHALCALLAERYKGKAENIWRGVDDAAVLFARLREFPGFGEEKAQIFVALLAKRMGVAPTGWKKVAGEFGDSKFRTVADITSAETLLAVRATKKEQKALERDKKDKPLAAKHAAEKKPAAKKKPSSGRAR